MTNRKKSADTGPDLFNLPPEPKEDTSAQEIVKKTTEYLGLVFDEEGKLLKIESIIKLGRKRFNEIVSAILLLRNIPEAKRDDMIGYERPLADYKKYSPVADSLINYATTEEQKHKSSSIEKPSVIVGKRPKGLSKKDQEQEQRRKLDDTFAIPRTIPGIPYIHIENDQLAMKFMIGLYGNRLIKDAFDKIDREIPPYDFPGLQDMKRKARKSFVESFKKSVPNPFRLLHKDEDVVKTREWKGRLTTRLKECLDERKKSEETYEEESKKMSDICYNSDYPSTGRILYTPTGVQYPKELLFNFRPHEWKDEILRRVEERKKYTEYIHKLRTLLKEAPIEGISIIDDLEAVRLNTADKKSEPLYVSKIFQLEESQWIPTIQERIEKPVEVPKGIEIGVPKETTTNSDVQEPPFEWPDNDNLENKSEPPFDGSPFPLDQEPRTEEANEDSYIPMDVDWDVSLPTSGDIPFPTMEDFPPEIIEEDLEVPEVLEGPYPPPIFALPLTNTQKLEPILDKCGGNIDKLIEYTDKLSELNVEISWQDKEITDTKTGATISFDKFLEDGPEFLKMNLLERLTDVRDEENDEISDEKNVDGPLDIRKGAYLTGRRFDEDDLLF